MKRLICRYPGDPPIEVLEMNQEEFLRAFPRRPTVLSYQNPDGTWTEEVLQEFKPHEILCDLCSAPYDDPTGLEPIYLYGGSHGRCQRCYKKSLEQYCTEAKKT